jgi:hypothetical protein
MRHVYLASAERPGGSWGNVPADDGRSERYIHIHVPRGACLDAVRLWT